MSGPEFEHCPFCGLNRIAGERCAVCGCDQQAAHREFVGTISDIIKNVEEMKA